MKANTISGQRQYAFVSQFNYIREAGTKGEEKQPAGSKKNFLKSQKMGAGRIADPPRAVRD